MNSAPTLIFPGVYRWSAYSPAHQVELTSHAVWDGVQCLVFDPIALPGDSTALPFRPDRIVLTNENHERDAETWREQLQIEIWASPAANLSLCGVRRWNETHDDWGGWCRFPLTGGPGGETAFFLASSSLMVFGDAVVHLPDRGLELLPNKYCRDPELLRTSLRRLPPFSQAIVAHGDPLSESASGRIAALL